MAMLTEDPSNQDQAFIPKLDVLELGGQPLDLKHFLEYDYDEIDAAMVELPPIIEYINHWLQIYNQQKSQAEAQLEVEKAKAYFALHNGLFEDRGYGGKKTAVAVLHAINLEKNVQEAKERLAIVEAWCGRLYNTMANLRSKIELVRSSESTRRAAFQSTQT